MFTLLVTLIVITASLLIITVLLQNSKKEGLGSTIGDFGATQLIGVQRTSDLLEQLTWIFVVSLFVLILASSLVLKNRKTASSPNIDRAQEYTKLPNAPAPDQAAPGNQ